MKVDWSAIKAKLPPEYYKITPTIAFARVNGKSICELDRIISEVQENTYAYLCLHAVAGDEFAVKIKQRISSDENIYDLSTETHIVRECVEMILNGIDPEQVYEIVDKARVLILNADMIHSALCVASGMIRSDI